MISFFPSAPVTLATAWLGL